MSVGDDHAIARLDPRPFRRSAALDRFDNHPTVVGAQPQSERRGAPDIAVDQQRPIFDKGRCEKEHAEFPRRDQGV